MVGNIRLSFALMLLAALVVLLAGERLARRDLIEKSEADRDDLEVFALDLREELTRLDDDLQDHLWDLASKCKEREEGVSDLIDDSSYLRSAYLIERSRKTQEWIPIPKIGQKSAPEVVAEGSRAPLNEKTAVAVTQEMIDDSFFGQSGWKKSSDRQYRLYWVCPEKGSIVAFMADFDVINQGVKKKIQDWGGERFSDLHGDQVKVALEAREGTLILGKIGEGASTTSMPLQTPLGDFWLRSWDHLVMRREYHLPTVMGAGLLALTLVGVGWLMLQSQKRAWREAEERVSFANRVSHELGTPLTNMTLNLDLAARSLRSDPKKAGQRLEKVREEVGRLGRLVGNVLTRTRKERGLLSAAPSANIPDEVVSSVLAQFRPALERREIEIDFKKGAADEFLFDADALSQVVWNLISNVEKHAAKGEWIGVETSLEEEKLIVSVRDRGEGISAKHRENIFKAFERIHAEVTEGASGTGLGLSISRDLAKMMGGKLELLPSDYGSLFQLSIPAVQP